MNLPKKEVTFDFEHKGLDTGMDYPGSFTVRCHLNMGLKHQLELERTRLQADYTNPSDGLAGLAIILSKLRVFIIDGPEWWEKSSGGMTIEDEDCLVALYNKVLQAEEEWKENIRAKGAEAKATTQTNPTISETESSEMTDSQ